MPLLDNINRPADLRKLPANKLTELALELRQATIEAVSQTGGHLGAGLGVIEITVATHYVFDTPNDKVIWDVGHQAYPHKILTERKSRINTIRQPQGLSAFTKRDESIYDTFGAGHSSTSISAATGIDIAHRLQSKENYTIAIIGDGAISAGMAFEAMNNAGYRSKSQIHNSGKLIVILNDNDMSISQPTGAMANYLAKLASCKTYFQFRNISYNLLSKLKNRLPAKIINLPRKLEKSIKEWWLGGNIFEELGFHYIGVVDGHNLPLLVEILTNVKNSNSNKPILIHCRTEKGKGYNHVMDSHDKLHAVSKFDSKTGISKTSKSPNLSYSEVFGRRLTSLAKNDKNIVAITAAMTSGTGLESFALEHRDRLFDVGIAEQHAVTFAGGLATEGIKPFVAIYSTFLQRALDQIIHDIALQKLAVRFIVDRAGFVGADGPTHGGVFDIAFLSNLPEIIIMAPINGEELVKMINTAHKIDYCPSAIRFPRGSILETTIDLLNNETIEIGKSEIIYKSPNNNKEKPLKLAIFALGTIIHNALAITARIEALNIDLTIINARFAKPLDINILNQISQENDIIISLEEGMSGGFATNVTNYLINTGKLDSGKLRFRSIFIDDLFVEHNEILAMQKEGKIDSETIFNTIKSLI
jgi:1-deoxy-D-xylulose-5-phosphate synthase